MYITPPGMLSLRTAEDNIKFYCKYLNKSKSIEVHPQLGAGS
jgi:hypothetical protein